jgi:SAM-dependent methyltransferase
MSDAGGEAMTEDIEWAEETAALTRSAAMWRPVDLETAGWQRPPRGGTVADVGCGAGGMAVVLAELVGPDGRVYAVDAEPALLDLARRRAADHGVDGWTRTVEADLGGDGGVAGALGQPVDLVWAAHVVHHLPDQQAAVGTLAGLLGPGGRLALAEGGFTPLMLPWDVGVGTPGLEARLRAAEDAWFNDLRDGLPDSVRAPYGWPKLLAAAGLVGITSRSFLLDLPSPLDPESREFVLSGLAKRVERVGDRLPGADREAFGRLLDRDDPAWLGRRDDLYLLGARTVHVGRRPA